MGVPGHTAKYLFEVSSHNFKASGQAEHHKIRSSAGEPNREADTREHRPGSDYQELGGEEQGEMVKCWEDGRSEGWQSLVGFVGFSS